MPAYNERYPWMSYYGNYDFFEDKMRDHSKVNNIQKIGDSLYVIDLGKEKSIRVFICECYSFGMAEYYETKENLGTIDAIIINSNWCGYTYDAKRYCLEHSVGLFDIAGFMAALNKEKYWGYLTGQEKEHFKKSGWI